MPQMNYVSRGYTLRALPLSMIVREKAAGSGLVSTLRLLMRVVREVC
jgi:hypothetical protein